MKIFRKHHYLGVVLILILLLILMFYSHAVQGV